MSAYDDYLIAKAACDEARDGHDVAHFEMLEAKAQLSVPVIVESPTAHVAALAAHAAKVAAYDTAYQALQAAERTETKALAIVTGDKTIERQMTLLDAKVDLAKATARGDTQAAEVAQSRVAAAKTALSAPK